MISIWADETLIIAAHPDDEILGAGGLMATNPGCHVAIVSEGTSMQFTEVSPVHRHLVFLDHTKALEAKREATRKAAKLLNFKIVAEGDFLDQRLHIRADVIPWIESVIDQVKPRMVITHRPTDLNQDHRVVCEATAVAVRPFVNSHRVRTFLGMSVDRLGWPEHSMANVFMPLSAEAVQMKIEALKFYESEVRPWPHPRSVEALEYAARDAGSAVFTSYAEAYLLMHAIIG